MSPRSWPSRFALWAAVFALLLKGAVPMLAATAAQLQGVPVAEVCPVYGVSLASAHGAPHAEAANGGHTDGEHAHHQHAHHSHHHHDPAAGTGHEDHKGHELASHGDHCALTALASLAGPDEVDWAIAPAVHVVASIEVHRTEPVPDACALWVARLKHGPPVTA